MDSVGVAVDITVVDNGQRRAPALVDVLPVGVRVLPSAGNPGFAYAANLALADWKTRHSSSPYGVIACHDLQVEVTTLAMLVEAADRHPTVGVLSPAILGAVPSAGGRGTVGTRHAYPSSRTLPT